MRHGQCAPVADVDLLIRGGTPFDVAIDDGRVAATGLDLGFSAAVTIEAAGLHVFPGAVDAHVHFNDPGRAEWEGWASGTAAAAAGGTTCVIDMPLNAHPPTVDATAFRAKVAAASGKALTDFALWGGLVPGNVSRLAELAELGVVGFKAFMSPSGIDDFEAADDLTLYEGMVEAARLGLPVVVHAESAMITEGLQRRATGRGWGDYLATRPVIAELEAISRAILLAENAGCALHVAHVSTGQGVRLVEAARARGSMSPARPVRTTSFSTKTTSSGSAESRSAPRRCAPAPSRKTSAPRLPPAGSTSWRAITPPPHRR